MYLFFVVCCPQVELAGTPIPELIDILSARSNVTDLDKDAFTAYKVRPIACGCNSVIGY